MTTYSLNVHEMKKHYSFLLKGLTIKNSLIIKFDQDILNLLAIIENCENKKESFGNYYRSLEKLSEITRVILISNKPNESNKSFDDIQNDFLLFFSERKTQLDLINQWDHEEFFKKI